MSLPANRQQYWVLGAGTFGRRAVARLLRPPTAAEVTVIDHAEAVHTLTGVRTVCADAINWLLHNLNRDTEVELIIPAVPLHVAAEWLKHQLAPFFRLQPASVPDSISARLPNPMRGGRNRFYASHADFLCPPDCSEPAQFCSHTGGPRTADLYSSLEVLRFREFVPLIIRSHQLLPGVGGILPADLWVLLDTIHQQRPPAIMIATACRCHGVIDFFKITSKSPTDSTSNYRHQKGILGN